MIAQFHDSRMSRQLEMLVVAVRLLVSFFCFLCTANVFVTSLRPVREGPFYVTQFDGNPFCVGFLCRRLKTGVNTELGTRCGSLLVNGHWLHDGAVFFGSLQLF